MNKLTKYILVIISITFSFYFGINKVSATTAARLNATINIRKGAGTNYGSIAQLSSGTTVYLVSTTKYSGTGCSAGWYKILYKDVERYACSNYVTIKTQAYYNTSSWTARTNATSSITVRQEPRSDKSNVIDNIIYGTNVTILGTSSNKGGTACTAGWYKVKYHNSLEGYICKDYVYVRENIMASDSTYEAKLKEDGFPDSYIPYLVYLHNKYPNWKFEAVQTKLDWDDVIDGESGSNATFSKISVYRTSSSPVDGNSWFEATDGLNAFFLDPRNFLNEKLIFVFEHLGYDSKYVDTYKSLVKYILGNGDLNTDEVVNAIIKSGEENKISPVHLASRMKQEVGINGGVATSGDKFTYDGKDYSGCYNFFNIGASDGSNAVYRGLVYACNKDWTTIEKAIIGGGAFLSDGYVSEGQYTLYFQKFNTSPTSSYTKYGHQYMSNVHAPSSEATSSYYSYKSANKLNDTFIFAIPIYNNMPSYISLPTIGDNTNTLSSITINGTSLEEFDSDVIGYTYYVSSDTSTIKLEVTSSSSKSTISGTGEIKLTTDSDTTVQAITVTSETGIEKTYTITLVKREGTSSINDIVSSSGLSVKNNIALNIKPGSKLSSLKDMIQKQSTSININFKNSSNTNISDTSTLISTGQKLLLSSSTENIEITLSVLGDTSGDGKITVLDLLQVQKHILNSTTLLTQRFEAGDTNDDNKITVLDLLRIQKYILGDLKF